MELKERYLKTIKDFKVKHAIEASDENTVATIHLMNTHQIDFDTAIDQTSKGGSDYGIDAWYFDEKDKQLLIYQSKLSSTKTIVLSAFTDFINALSWLDKVIIKGVVEKVPANNAIYNLYSLLSQKKGYIKKISFVLISPFNSNEIEDELEFKDTEKQIRNSELFKVLNGKISLEIEEYNFEKFVPKETKKYPIKRLTGTTIKLRPKSQLDLAYIPLYNLVELYRHRGDTLFHKNVRLSLINNKDAKNRVVNPMEDTFEQICSGKLSPNIFPFYHVGITIAATINYDESPDVLALESPYIINGCQTVTIAADYLNKIHDKNKAQYLETFKKINVIAKIVIGTTDDELKEITNCNNRQNPIENWQLFSNDQVHIEIENVLKEYGVFYERQKGKFDTIMKKADSAKYYNNTNNTYIDIPTLGQILCFCQNNLQWAAKPSEIFIKKNNHDSVFTKDIPKHPRDIILVYNMFHAIKRGLANYLLIPAHDNDQTKSIFTKPIVRAHVYWIALLYYYQKKFSDINYATKLHKKASPIIVTDFETLYAKIISKTKAYYIEQSKNLEVDVSSTKLDIFFKGLCIEIGVDEEGKLPFTNDTIEWNKYEEKDKFSYVADLEF